MVALRTQQTHLPRGVKSLTKKPFTSTKTLGVGGLFYTTKKGELMDILINLIMGKVEEEDRDGKAERQLGIIVKKEDEFLKDFSKEKRSQYLDLEMEKLKYQGMETEQAVRVAIKILKEIYK